MKLNSLFPFFFSFALVPGETVEFVKLLVYVSRIQECFKNYLYFLLTVSGWHFYDTLLLGVIFLTSFGTAHCNSLIILNLGLC